MADGQVSSPTDDGSKHTAAEQDPAQLDSEKRRLEIEKLKLEIDALRQTQRPVQKIAITATAISAMIAVVGAVVGVVLSSGALSVQTSSFYEDRRHHEREEISSIIEKLTEEKASIQRRMALVWALRQYWWGDNSEVLSNALGTLILNDDDLNVIQAAGLAFGRISHDNPNWPKTKRVLFGSAAEGDKGAILRFNLALQPHPPAGNLTNTSLNDERFLALGDAVRLNWADLRGVNLALANLKNCELYLAHLEDADLSGANLEGADLRGAHLERANLFKSNLRSAKLKGAHLDGANVRDAILEAPSDEKNGHRYDGTPVKEDLDEWLQSKGMALEVIDKIRTERELATKTQRP